MGGQSGLGHFHLMPDSVRIACDNAADAQEAWQVPRPRMRMAAMSPVTHGPVRRCLTCAQAGSVGWAPSGRHGQSEPPMLSAPVLIFPSRPEDQYSQRWTVILNPEKPKIGGSTPPLTTTYEKA